MYFWLQFRNTTASGRRQNAGCALFELLGVDGRSESIRASRDNQSRGCLLRRGLWRAEKAVSWANCWSKSDTDPILSRYRYTPYGKGLFVLHTTVPPATSAVACGRTCSICYRRYDLFLFGKGSPFLTSCRSRVTKLAEPSWT